MSLEKTKETKKNISNDFLLDILIHKEKVLPLLSQIQGLLDKRSHLQILSNVMIKAEKDSIKIYASDSELSFCSYFKGKIQKEGQVVIDGKKLFEIIKELPNGEISISGQNNNQVKIQKDQSIFKIHSLNPDDFPIFPSIDKDLSFCEIPVEDMLNVIDKTIYCTSLDESRYHLTGVYCEPVEAASNSCRFVATDGHRMSFIDIPVNKKPFKDSFIIPKKALQEIKKMISFSEQGDVLELALEKPRLIVRFQNQILIIRLIEGNYPNYKLLIPKKAEKKITLSRNVFFTALKRISVLTSLRHKGVVFTFSKKTLMIAIAHPELGEAKETIECDYSGEEIKIRFNAKYILDILQSLSESKVKISLKDHVSAGLIQAADSDKYNCIVMPIKL